MTTRTAVLIIALLFIPAIGFTATLQVPGQYPHIQDAIDAAMTGDIVLVDPGSYQENIDFIGKAITVKSTGGPAVTVIDGKYPPTLFESVVRFLNNEGPDSVIDGFKLVNGTGTINPTWGELGGGIVCQGASPTIRNNIIVDNSANFGGGIECIDSASPLIEGNVIMNNNVSHQSGGGIDMYANSSPVIINNIIAKNEAVLEGGGIAVWNGCKPVVMNNTVSENTAGTGGGLYVFGSPSITNTIIWNNVPTQISGSITTVSFCDVEGGWSGKSNIDADPCFNDPANADFHLDRRSPCINRGTNEGAPAGDIDGDSRPFMGTVDMGADEFTGLHPLAADAFSVSEASGGQVNFVLEGGAINAGRAYMLLGTVSGTVPGIPLPGGMTAIPLNWDIFTNFVIGAVNTPVFSNFLASLDVSGQASALFDTLGPLPAGTAGIVMHFAYTLAAPFDFVSNPQVVEIVP